MSARTCPRCVYGSIDGGPVRIELDPGDLGYSGPAYRPGLVLTALAMRCVRSAFARVPMEPPSKEHPLYVTCPACEGTGLDPLGRAEMATAAAQRSVLAEIARLVPVGAGRDRVWETGQAWLAALQIEALLWNTQWNHLICEPCKKERQPGWRNIVMDGCWGAVGLCCFCGKSTNHCIYQVASPASGSLKCRGETGYHMRALEWNWAELEHQR